MYVYLSSESDSGLYDDDDLTNDTTPDIVGYARDYPNDTSYIGSIVHISSDLDGDLGTVIVGANGLFEVTLPELSQGHHDIYFSIFNSNGSLRDRDLLEIGIDTYAAISINEPELIDGVIDEAFTLRGTTVGVNKFSVVTMILTDINGQTLELTDEVSRDHGNWQLDVSEIDLAGLAPGSVTVDVSTTDRAGNIATAQTMSLTLADILPTITIDTSTGTGADGFINSAEHSVPLNLSGTVTGAIENGQTVNVTISDINNNMVHTTARVNEQQWTLNLPVTYSQTQVNTTILSYQGDSQIEALTDGGYVVTWASLNQDGDLYGIYLQRYDVEDYAVGNEVLVNTTTTSSQDNPALAALTDGGYVVSWTSTDQDGDAEGIYLQRYDALGNTVGSEDLVNSTTTMGQSNSSITALSDGGYVVSWTSSGQDGDADGIYLQRYDAAGNAVGFETLVNSTTDSFQRISAIESLVDGGYVVTWSSLSATSGYDIYLQRYDAAGNTVGGETAVNTNRHSNQDSSAIAALADGGYVVTWSSWDQDGKEYGIYLQRYDALSNTVGSETLVNSTTANNESQPDITALIDGGYVVSWQSEDPYRHEGMYLQRYHADGNREGSETVLNSYFLYNTHSAITALADGGYIVSWNAFDYSDDGVYFQRFTADGTTTDVIDNRADLSGLVDGLLTITASVVDVEGTLGSTQDTSVIVDTSLSAPTVNTVDTSNTAPWLSGTFDADNTQTLTVTVEGETYTLGVDVNLYQHANNDNIWVLKPQGFYHLGEHDVVVTATNSNGLSVVDQTTGELTITRDMVAPRVNLPKQIYNKRPAVGGTFDEAATEELTVELDGTVYTLGVDAELSNHLNNKWVLNLSTLETPLSDGVYDVIVNTTDANSVTLQDASTGELTIGMLAPTVYELESTNFKPVLRGFYDADFGDGLTVTVNGDSYTLGVDGELTTHASNDNLWVLRPSNALNFGDNDIQVVATDTKGKDKTGITSDEIHIYQSKSQAADGDVLITQEGDDTITINDNTFTQINAGLGVDTLILDGDAISLNFANIQSIDVVDMNDAASTVNTLTLTLDDVLTKTDNSSLSILGDSADTVTLATADNWNTNGSQVIDGVTFDGYDSGAASLLIEQGVVVQVV